VIVGLLFVAGGYADWKSVSPPKISALYDPPWPPPVGKPDEIIRTESRDLRCANTRVWCILYYSTDFGGNNVAVSAIIAAWTTAAPADGYPLVVVGHGTGGTI
jgi:hypothetical protein